MYAATFFFSASIQASCKTNLVDHDIISVYTPVNQF